MIKTEKVFYNYVSAAPFEAEILELRPLGDGGDGKTSIVLDKTIFYPDGGGQPADRGTINGVPLLDVRDNDGEISHLVSAADAGILKPGKAELLLDLRRRRDYTALHSGQHILSGTIISMIGAPTVSMHLGDETYTIDLDTPEMSDEFLVTVEEAVANVIEENRPVTIHLCPPEDIGSFPLRKVPPMGEEVIRVVEIEGCDIIACCGTHVKRTGEIGLFRIHGAEKYKGMTRVSFSAGRRLLLESRSLRQNAAVVSHALSVPLGEIGKGVLDFIDKTAQTEKRLKALEEKIIQEKAEALVQKAGNSAKQDAANPSVFIIESYVEESIDEVQNIGKAVQKKSQAAFILASEQDRKFVAFCSAKGFDLRAFIKGAFDAQGGRGGGSPSFFQGSFGTKEAMDAFLAEMGR
ncbi:MAG: alanyl-tRNA editing protein [Treponema sp.]|jgi:alanyl-tRNA synthetase|nr:alanyl-tRNA editing protein [Treponema sp.]